MHVFGLRRFVYMLLALEWIGYDANGDRQWCHAFIYTSRNILCDIPTYTIARWIVESRCTVCLAGCGPPASYLVLRNATSHRHYGKIFYILR